MATAGKRKREDGAEGAEGGVAAAEKRPRMLAGEVEAAKAERRTPFLVRQYVINPISKVTDGTATVENISQVRPGEAMLRGYVGWADLGV